jgi:polar amino acid transport system permease protein
MTLETVFILMGGVPYTLAVTCGALFIGLILGFPLMLLRMARWPVARGVAMLLIAVIRSVPPIVWLFLIFFGIGSGLFPIDPLSAALVGFGLIAAVNLAEVYRAGMLAVHPGQAEAAAVLNMNRWHSFIDIIAPQMFRVSIPMIATFAIGLLKDAAVASTIGVTDLSYQGRYLTQITYNGLTIMGLVGLIYIGISLPISWLAHAANVHLKERVAL